MTPLKELQAEALAFHERVVAITEEAALWFDGEADAYEVRSLRATTRFGRWRARRKAAAMRWHAQDMRKNC